MQFRKPQWTRFSFDIFKTFNLFLKTYIFANTKIMTTCLSKSVLKWPPKLCDFVSTKFVPGFKVRAEDLRQSPRGHQGSKGSGWTSQMEKTRKTLIREAQVGTWKDTYRIDQTWHSKNHFTLNNVLTFEWRSEYRTLELQNH